MAPRIGFIGIIGDLFKEDPEGTLSWVADLGFEGMEGAAALASYLGVSVKEARARLESAGLAAAVQGRTSYDQSNEEVREVIALAKEMGSKYVVDYFAPFADRDEILRYCEYFTRVGKMCREEGVTFLYHNHDHEMKKHDGVRGIDILLENTDPEIVKVELDVAWVTFGGADPVAIIEKTPERFPVLHMKDFAHLHPGSAEANGVRKEAVFAEVGTGVVDAAGVVEVAKRVGVEWLVIEQDRMNTMGPKESLETSFARLKALVDA